MVIALDIDGVLSRYVKDVEFRELPDDYTDLPFGAAWVQDPQGVTRLLHTAPAVIVELDEILQSPGVQLAWVTAMPEFVPRAIELAFGGRLTDGALITDPNRPSNWKQTQLLLYLRSQGNPPYVWIDKSAIEFACRVSPAFRNGDIGPSQRLLISTNLSVGLTLDDIESIREFGQDVLEGKP